jgi:hypothetical protein
MMTQEVFEGYMEGGERMWRMAVVVLFKGIQ